MATRHRTAAGVSRRGYYFKPGRSAQSPHRLRGTTATWFVVGTSGIDTTSPLTVFVSESRSKVSLVAGFESTIAWTVNEDCQAWQIREVADAATTLGSAGLLVTSGGPVTAGVEQQTVIGGASLTAGDGARLLKIFAQDLAGNWTA